MEFLAKGFSFKCGICFDENWISKIVTFQTCNNQKEHTFCSDCIRRYFETQINAYITDIKCPGLKCSGIVSESAIKLFVSDEKYVKYLRFKAMHNDPNYRECDAFETRLTFAPYFQPISCPQCGVSNCFLHGCLHSSNESCAQFVYRTEHAIANDNIIATTTKKCPQCGVNTEKISGCDSLRCTRCGCSWTWSPPEKLKPQNHSHTLTIPTAMLRPLPVGTVKEVPDVNFNRDDRESITPIVEDGQRCCYIS